MNFLLDADYSAIECRIVNWLAGQEDVLQRFRAYDAATTGEEKNALDPYRIQAAAIFNVPVETVNKFPQRFVGKTAELGCGFGMGKANFRSTCKKYGYDLPLGLENVAVDTYRSTHRKVERYWGDVDKCAKQAILRPGEIVQLRNVAFLVKDVEGISFLLIRLPSGRKLAYPRPYVGPSRKFEGSTTIYFYGLIKGKTWGDVDTYGGKLVENITQAAAADIMAHGAHNAENAGYQIATLIHDQALAYYEPSWQTPEEFERLLTTLPEWADGLPVAAEGGLVPFYRKD